MMKEKFSQIDIFLSKIYTTEKSLSSLPIYIIEEKDKIDDSWLKKINFKFKSYHFEYVPNTNGDIQAIYSCVDALNNQWTLSALSSQLPCHTYHLEDKVQNCLSYYYGWAMGMYQQNLSFFDTSFACLYLPPSINKKELFEKIKSTLLIRELINQPAAQLTPVALKNVSQEIACLHQADFTAYVGQELLDQNYPSIYAVGQGSHHPAALIDIKWGQPNHPKITLIGKGITFDTGGLNLKSDTGMRLMKKDMAGAAHVLGLAHLLMAMNFPIQLRVLIPAAENAISSTALRPYDVIQTRKGKTVEITHTDAEGRVVLADALWEASSENPDLIIDFATLTGSARQALGPDISAFFTNDAVLQTDLLNLSREAQDPLWPLPLWQPYKKYLKGRTADLCNDASSGLASEFTMAGAITAALYLQEFIQENDRWVHFDILGCQLINEPGRPEGGTAVGIWALYAYLKKTYLK